MTTFLLPLQNIPQSFEIQMAGVNYFMIVRWNDAADAGWVLDIADAVTKTPIVCNIPFITGADLLAGLEYFGINGRLVVFTDGDQFAVPTLENLGVESNLYFLTEVV